jgi:hypothetical protein
VDFPGDFVDNKGCGRPFEGDMSGLLLTTEGPGFERLRIRFVAETTPAAIFDLREGDLFVAVNGRAVRGSDLEKVRQMLMREGQQLTRKIQLGGVARKNCHDQANHLISRVVSGGNSEVNLLLPVLGEYDLKGKMRHLGAWEVGRFLRKTNSA